MEAWKRFYGEAVKDGRFNDTQDNLTSYKRGWDNTGRALGRTKQPVVRPEPEPQDEDEFAWMYE